MHRYGRARKLELAVCKTLASKKVLAIETSRSRALGSFHTTRRAMVPLCTPDNILACVRHVVYAVAICGTIAH